MNTERNDSKIELSYLKKQRYIIAKVSRKTYRDLDAETVAQLIARAKKKLDAEKSAGRIVNYTIEPGTLQHAWLALKNNILESNDNDKFAIPFGFGVIEFPQVNIAPPGDEDSFCEISIDTSADEISTWNMGALSTFVKSYVHSRQWSNGCPDKKAIVKLCKQARLKAVDRKRIPKVGIHDGVKSFKIQTGAPVLTHEKQVVQQNAPPPTSDSYPGKNLLQVEISEGGMVARIKEFKIAWYNRPELKFDAEWLAKEAIRLGLKGSTTDYYERLKDKVRRSADINGLQVVGGTPSIPGTGAFLAPVIAKTDSNNQPGQIAPALISCTSGAIVAEIRHRSPAVPGIDVYGIVVPALGSETMEVELGDGIERVGVSQFRAIQDGLLKIDGNKICVLKTFVIDGDVTINSGNIDFRGNIMITGNVDAGSRVSATGDITIEGNIQGGSVRCLGNLAVSGGINTSDGAAIRCSGSLKSSFIERAVLYVKGNMTVENSIVQSTIYCGGNISVTSSEGRLGGSSVYAWGDLNTTKLGFATGATTFIYLGEDWKEARRTAILKKRLQKLTDLSTKEKNEERTLSTLKKAQLTKKKIELKALLHKRISKIDAIMSRIEVKLAKLKESRKLNYKSKLTTTFAADGDVIVTLAGEELKSPQIA